MRRLLCLLACLSMAGAAQAKTVAVGDWVQITLRTPDQAGRGEADTPLSLRFSIVGQETDAGGDTLVWLEMALRNDRYPIVARLLVPAALFEREEGSQEAYFAATKRLVGQFGHAPAREYPSAEAATRLGGYFVFLAANWPGSAAVVSGIEDVQVADTTLTCTRKQALQSTPESESVLEATAWLTPAVPIAGFARVVFVSRSRAAAAGAPPVGHTQLIEAVAFGTDAVSALPGFGMGGAAAASAVPARHAVDDSTFAQIVAKHAYDRSLPLDSEVVDTQEYDGRKLPYATDKVRFHSLNNEVVIGYFAYQAGPSRPRVPAVILLHGNNGFRGSRDRWAADWLDLLAREGYCVLAIDQCGFGERFARPESLEGRDLWTQAAADSRRAIDYLFTRNEVDTTRIALVGQSMGGVTACVVAGLEDRLATVVLVVATGWPAAASPREPRLAPKHPLNFAPRIRCPVLMLGAKDDEYIEREDAEALFALIKAPKKLVWQRGEHAIPVEQQRQDILPWLRKHLR